DRHDAGGRAGRRGDGAPPVHLLDLRADRDDGPEHLDGLRAGDHLRVLRVAGSESQRPGVGGSVCADRVRPRYEPDRADHARALAAQARAPLACSPLRHRVVTLPQPTLSTPTGTLATN